MKKLFIVQLLSFLVMLSSCVDRQQADISAIKYVSFDVNSYRTTLKDKPSVALYCEIDSIGAMKITRDDDHNGQYKGLTAQLSPNQINFLQSVFQEKIRLATLIKEYTFKKDSEFFAGSYDYYYINYKNGKKDSICTISPFMSDTLHGVDEMLSNIYYGDSTKNSSVIIQPTSDFLNSMFNCFLKNKLLPPISTLPSFRLKDNPQLKK
jgi:hypothetical protein